MSAPEWRAISHAASTRGQAPEERLLGDMFQALDRLEHRSHQDDRKSNHGISVCQLYLVQPPTSFGPCCPLSLL